MAKIIIPELHYTDSDSFLLEINDIYSRSIYGGEDYPYHYGFYQVLNFTYKLADLMLSAFGIYSIVSLTKSFVSAEFDDSFYLFVPASLNQELT
ncbi:hypothetical protein NWP17_01410 [Chrysosporum bergii ANA360D]|jgi:hypothetical protein|uniref:Uncharacterized protein n=1 Tax=Chrysosporum bergii ANA360D TaxID=617107 RepID=A0AA43KAD9_9CYAN|nr:hypothetical protein [Chrysosporum bergii]MDH6059113.1 hypothetical protein [Chrysosporum bergii ANA360D]